MLQSPTLPDCKQTKTITPIGLTKKIAFERPVKVSTREAPIPSIGFEVIGRTSLTTESATDDSISELT